MARLLQIAQLGHPVLRRTAEKVSDVTAVSRLIDDMMATVKEAAGVGIAAPQVYESKQIFIMASAPNSRYPHAPKMAPTAMINPEIIHRSEEMESDWEGCLSIPGIRALVPRSARIKVGFTTREGKTKQALYNGFLARVFQHEVDHLNGKVFLDRVISSMDIVTEKEYKKIITESPDKEEP